MSSLSNYLGWAYFINQIFLREAIEVLENDMKKLILIGTLMAAPASMHSQTIDGSWLVTEFFGDSAFLIPSEIIGTYQTFSGSSATGPFYNCSLGGQYMSYTKLNINDLLEIPILNEFYSISDELRAAGTTAFVHTVSCNGDGKLGSRQKFTPFVTIDDSLLGWYPFEGGVFTLKMSKK